MFPTGHRPSRHYSPGILDHIIVFQRTQLVSSPACILRPLPPVPNALRAREGSSGTAQRTAAGRWPDHLYPAGWRSSPSLRTARCMTDERPGSSAGFRRIPPQFVSATEYGRMVRLRIGKCRYTCTCKLKDQVMDVARLPFLRLTRRRSEFRERQSPER
jgi:hypothetical protein